MTSHSIADTPENEGHNTLILTYLPSSTFSSAEITLGNVLFKAQLWDKINQKTVNDRQRLIINRMLEDDLKGHMNISNNAKLAKYSNDTALRGIQDLNNRDIFIQNPGGGRSSSYRLPNREEF